MLDGEGDVGAHGRKLWAVAIDIHADRHAAAGGDRWRRIHRPRTARPDVICAAVEYRGDSQSKALETIEEKLRFNTRAVLELAAEKGRKPREAAMQLAQERVRKAMSLRRWG